MKYNKFAKDILLINYKSIKDSRGKFSVLYNKKDYSKILKNEFEQENISYSSKKNTIRGIHLQLKPDEQGKLLTVIKGEILDVIIDLRVKSKTFKKIFYFKLNEKLNTQLFIPRGFGHGFCTLTDNTIVSYKVDNKYNPKKELTIKYNDPDLSIKWPKINSKIYLSKKDIMGITFKKYIENNYG